MIRRYLYDDILSTMKASTSDDNQILFVRHVAGNAFIVLSVGVHSYLQGGNGDLGLEPRAKQYTKIVRDYRENILLK